MRHTLPCFERMTDETYSCSSLTLYYLQAGGVSFRSVVGIFLGERGVHCSAVQGKERDTHLLPSPQFSPMAPRE